VLRQRAIWTMSVEIIFGSYQTNMCQNMRVALQSCKHLQTLRIRIVHFKYDVGLYAMWDDLVNHIASANILTNWNLDDRKAPLSLEKRATMLSRDSNIDAVSSQVYIFDESETPVTWRDAIFTTRSPEHDLGNSRPIQFSDMMRFNGYKIKGSRNVPHNSPMWRRRVHAIVGPFAFNRSFQPGCLDYSFWLRALYAGRTIFHMNEPLEIYVSRPESHGHLTHQTSVSTDSSEWKNECDPSALWSMYKLHALQTYS
jgi:hypothetical protein